MFGKLSSPEEITKTSLGIMGVINHFKLLEAAYELQVLTLC